MNIVDVYIGRDFYDFKRHPSHQFSETNVSDEKIEETLEAFVKEFKAKKIPWYLMVVTTYEIGGDINTVHYHNAHKQKEKIILNKPALESKKTITLEGLVTAHQGLIDWGAVLANQNHAVINPNNFVVTVGQAQLLEEEPDHD